MRKDLCHLCGQLVCEHPHRRISSFNNQHHNFHEHNYSPISLGEKLGEPVSIKYSDSHLDRLDDDGNPLSIQNPDLPKDLKSMLSITDQNNVSNINDWVKCNLCPSKIHINYITSHLKTHAYIAEKNANKNISSATQASSAAIVRVSDYTSKSTSGSSSSSEPTWSSLIAKSESKDKNKPTIQSLEKYKFRELNHVCAFGSSSKSGRYSDFTIVFWTNEVSSVQNTSYYGTGVSSYVSKDWERLQIHTVYDNLEDYYVVSCKLSRRGQYSSWDNDDSIPDRICFQHELITEIKRAMLFFRVNPKSAYKMFRKLFNQNIKVVSDPEDGKVLFSYTENYDELSNKLKGSSSYGSNHNNNSEAYHGYEGRGWC